MYQWLIDNKESKKIQAVLGIGDITEHCCDDEWALANEAATMMENAGFVLLLHFSEDHNTVTTELISTNKNQYYKSKYQTSFTLNQ